MIRSFGIEFDAFEEAMRGVDGRYTAVRRHRHDWWMQNISLGEIEVMLCQDGGGNIFEGSCGADNYALFLPLTHVDSLIVNGRSVQSHSLAWLTSGAQFDIYNSGVLQWVGIVIGRTWLNRWLRMRAVDCRWPTQEHLVGIAGSARFVSLRDLILRLFSIQDTDPGVFLSSLTVAEARDQLMWRVHDALSSIEFPAADVVGRPKIDRTNVIRRVKELLDLRIDEPLRVTDLCAWSGVSRGTLQTVFLEHFGVGPNRYVMLQRMASIHKALKLRNPDDTVAQICNRFGVWDMGRFAGRYQQIYGVTPSVTKGIA